MMNILALSMALAECRLSHMRKKAHGTSLSITVAAYMRDVVRRILWPGHQDNRIFGPYGDQ